MKVLKNNRGFTLIEVVAAIIIVTIILISFYQLFIQTNKTAVVNNERLVTINLADAALAKVQAKTYTKLNSGTLDDYFKDSDKEIEMNGRKYSITYTPSQSDNKVQNSNYSEKELNLIKVVVTVTAQDGKTNASSEGYVRYE